MLRKSHRFYLLLLILMTGSCINKNTEGMGCIMSMTLKKFWSNTSTTKLTVAPVSSTQIDLFWSDIPKNNVKDFKIERSENGIDFIEIAKIPSNNTSYSDKGLDNGKTYWYRLSEYNNEQVSSNTSSATLPWAKTYAGEENNVINSMQATTDGGYIIAGNTNSFGMGKSDILIVKLNPDGTIAWEKAYGGEKGDSACCIQQTNDGGYIVMGRSASFEEDSGLWLFKLKPDGTIMWQKYYAGSLRGKIVSIQQTKDGGYIAAGSRNSVYGVGAGGEDLWVLKFDSEGRVEWEKMYGGEKWDEATSIQQAKDGGYIVAGYLDSSNLLILKLKANGKIAWQRIYERAGKPFIIQLTPDDGYIIAGNSYFMDKDYDVWILELNSEGDILWKKTYGGYKKDTADFIQPTSDGGYIVAGATNSFDAKGYDFWVLRLDSTGNINWQKSYGGAGNDFATSIQQTTDGGYIVAGDTDSFGAGVRDILILKLSIDGTASSIKNTITMTNTSAAAADLERTLKNTTISLTVADTKIISKDVSGMSKGTSLFVHQQ